MKVCHASLDKQHQSWMCAYNMTPGHCAFGSCPHSLHAVISWRDTHPPSGDPTIFPRGDQMEPPKLGEGGLTDSQKQLTGYTFSLTLNIRKKIHYWLNFKWFNLINTFK